MLRLRKVKLCALATVDGRLAPLTLSECYLVMPVITILISPDRGSRMLGGAYLTSFLVEYCNPLCHLSDASVPTSKCRRALKNSMPDHFRWGLRFMVRVRKEVHDQSSRSNPLIGQNFYSCHLDDLEFLEAAHNVVIS